MSRKCNTAKYHRRRRREQANRRTNKLDAQHRLHREQQERRQRQQLRQPRDGSRMHLEMIRDQAPAGSDLRKMADDLLERREGD